MLLPRLNSHIGRWRATLHSLRGPEVFPLDAPSAPAHRGHESIGYLIALLAFGGISSINFIEAMDLFVQSL